MTPDEWLEAIRQYEAYWPDQKLSTDSTRMWYQHLRTFNAEHVYRALWHLSEVQEFAPKLAAIIAATQDIVRDYVQREATRAAAQRAIPFGADPSHPHDQHWNALPEKDKKRHLNNAMAHWRRDVPWIKATKGSPLVVAMAAAMARGVDMDPGPSPVVGMCRSCGHEVRLSDRTTRTHTCTGCLADFVGNPEDFEPLREPPERDFYQRCPCGAALVYAGEPSKGVCRNHPRCVEWQRQRGGTTERDPGVVRLAQRAYTGGTGKQHPMEEPDEPVPPR